MLNVADINNWADDPKGPVALHLKQPLLPIEGKGGVIFPPTYADQTDYGVERLSDGRTIVTIDSMGSQANRIEPIFRRANEDEPANELAELVPQIEIRYGEGENKKTVSILEVGHRLGDALVRSSSLKEQANQAFSTFLDTGDASKIAKLAPTSIVFGAWDSRDTQAKLPRILQSVIRAWDVDVLKRSAQYTPPVDYEKMGLYDPEEKKQIKDQIAARGFGHVPSVDTEGGVVARGPIERHITINLIALRRLRGDGENTQTMRRYILGLALVAATEPLDGFLRQGCLLSCHPEHPAQWESVSRCGGREPIDLNRACALEYAKAAKQVFPVVRDKTFDFNKKLADDDLKDITGKTDKGKAK